jgi:hypothetical protein
MQNPIERLPEPGIDHHCCPFPVSLALTPLPLFGEPPGQPPCPVGAPGADEAHHENLLTGRPPLPHHRPCHVPHRGRAPGANAAPVCAVRALWLR